MEPGMTGKITDLTFSDYLLESSNAKEVHSSWRMGQAYFNTLHKFRPDLSELVRGSMNDPFNNDLRIGDFMYWIYLNW